ncbi:aminotransferase class I/II-fold pyridoxal phosphate-dependent enzyme [Halalkalibacterium halodurans]|jgi:cystathionine gamma-synthase|uniref:aminotransferase class I/II-fold pyridoxal phosphate-dependent enzyme n=2 Tax=Halalkalibacterium halodurans TaxID=86665 RepID=UPI002AA99C49|nr:aminotransferase class I/II-fold pyridoxal phosphate-dependent enzyme [Halalkalibacterium halodurans]MDY7221038.1 aminotransferase class I/II-fold pyridoxal phosphate-dependent enzyme [Halalkalibacterium halodurans]MDY7240277.1 aminotransferase class I/II-fold pyridoxal phosphate-dependent enzyme [Halalkalibacterium halodurans]MED4079927.1 aminotransferase class I/II-fold pyridoxal phosphate-dependent enzyme [Halalkalibacterium halodurans]MED4086692.1 aminotransferase class I/II-fold pyridox
MREKKFATKSVHFTEKEISKNRSKSKPIYQTSAFVFQDLDDMESFYRGEKEYLYTRYGNPNSDDLGKGVASLEQAEDGVATSAGMSAILVALLALLEKGDHLIAANDLYGGTYQLLAEELPKLGIDVSFVPFQDREVVKRAIRKETKVLYSETVTNPLLRVEDIYQVVELGKEHGLSTVIDNTFATPYFVQPLTCGVDVVVHSATKYIGGHSDVTAGVVVGSAEIIQQVRQKVATLGCNLSPFEAWLASRGLKTLALRMERQGENAQALATFFADHPGVSQVFYPTTVSKRGNGAIVTIRLAEKVEAATFFESLDWVKIAPTLAGVETTVSYPIQTSHRTVPESLRQELGIDKQLVRISVGIEDIEDIMAAFDKAIKKAGS